MSKPRLGLAICGSYCTFDKILPVAEALAADFELTVIMSENAAGTDTRFGCAENMRKRLEEISGREVICSIAAAEPIGPKKLLDILAVAPCTGNTLAKLACGIADTAVTMAVKAHLRNNKPVILGIATNDALGATAKNLGLLHNTKNIYFVPYKQDDPYSKNNSLVCDFTKIPETVEAALGGVQLQPVII